MFSNVDTMQLLLQPTLNYGHFLSFNKEVIQLAVK